VIFVDTSFFFPLLSAHDRDHPRVRRVIEQLGNRRLPDRLLTTNHVVGETITLARVRGGHELAVQVGRQLYAEKMARIHWASPDQEKAAFEYLARHGDKEYSFTDCLSFVVMDAFGITEAWAVDSDFTHRFVVKPGPAGS
jgi:predicted nucleic acid-binding protein